jgi:response regulator RpfG family c-di-GMP phosphodiesterase
LSQNKSSKAKIAPESKIKTLKKLFIFDDLSGSYELINAFLKNKYVIDSKNLNDFNSKIIGQKDVEAFVLDVTQIQWKKCLQICKTIKREDPLKRPVIIISSEFIEEKIKQFYNAGADKFLVKPFSKSDLVGILESLSI